MTNASDEPMRPDQNLPSEFSELNEHIRQVDVTRPISKQEIQCLIDRYPFLGIFDAQTDFTKIQELPTPRWIKAETGWIIQDYGFYICGALGEALYGNYAWALSKEGEGEKGGTAMPGKGTLAKQTFDTAAEMVALGRQHGWKEMYILEGHPRMKWSAWVIAEELGILVDGYTPSRQDQERRDRLKRGEQLDQIGIRLRLY